MNTEVENIIRKRKAEGCCIICGKYVKDSDKDVISMHHFLLGTVLVEEKHIKFKES
jgi:hypothetical protein